MIRRESRTDLAIVQDGDFVKVGKKHFAHIDGAEIKYDCNAWAWRTSDGMKFTGLHAAVSWVRSQNRRAA